MDIDRVKMHRVSKSNDSDEAVAFSLAAGVRMSAMEHLVPEQVFSIETAQAQGISAVKALAIAAQEGQKIWTIDKNNLELALSRIKLGSDAEADIRNAVNAGKQATAHEARINFHGWIGEGYVLVDPKTGAGAYMISGGGNGSEITGGKILELISQVLGVAGTFIDIMGELLKEVVGEYMDAFRILLGAASKMFSIVSRVIDTGLGIKGILVNCPIEVYVVMLPILLFMLGMAWALIALTLMGIGAVFAGVVAGALVGLFTGGVIDSCKRGVRE
ncbi:MAG: hypothetical protein ACI4NJ_01170 [Cellvibrio sp.]